ncbi:hypothetical protein D3C73_1115160 [compost metagenome]
MSGGQYKTVTVNPSRMIRVVIHCFGKKLVTHWCGAHRHTRVAGVGFFNRIDSQCTDGCDCQVIHRRILFFMDCLFFCLFSHYNNPPLNQECHFDYYCITNVEAFPIVFVKMMLEQHIILPCTHDLCAALNREVEQL